MQLICPSTFAGSLLQTYIKSKMKWKRKYGNDYQHEVWSTLQLFMAQNRSVRLEEQGYYFK